VWEATTGKEIARMTLDNTVDSVAFSPDGKYIVSGGADNTVRVWEASTGQEVARMFHDSAVTSAVFSPDLKYVVSASVDSTVRVWIWQSNDLIADACSRVTRNPTRFEWQKYFGDALHYQAICPNLPIEPEPTPVPSATP
jgi:WD40 repeat protein